MKNINLIEDISDFMREIDQLRTLRDNMSSHHLMRVITPQLQDLNSEFWPITYYANGISGEKWEAPEDAEDKDHPIQRVYRLTSKVSSILKNSIESEQILGKVDHKIANKAEGKFPYKYSY